MVFPVVMYGHELDHKEGCTKGTKLSRSVVAIPGTVAYQAPPSMECSRQEYWSAGEPLNIREQKGPLTWDINSSPKCFLDNVLCEQDRQGPCPHRVYVQTQEAANKAL